LQVSKQAALASMVRAEAVQVLMQVASQFNCATADSMIIWNSKA